MSHVKSCLGALPLDGGTRFRVIAPHARTIDLHLLSGPAAGVHRLTGSDGVFETFVRGASAGDRYAYAIDGGEPRPDPASRFQPDGVHAPSAIVDPNAYRWRSTDWTGRDPRDLSIYELHVGTFSPKGTFEGVREKLPEIKALGVTAIELMPIADFAGSRNWGYDGTCLFAPSRAYGQPDDLRALVDTAHELGLAVILDVVYNHLGPEGAYLPQFDPDYITEKYHTPWGGAVNLDGPGSDFVRHFIVDNAVHWITEYRFDGLRLDATHALIDRSGTHVVKELADAVRAAAPHQVAVFAEDHRNLAALVEPKERGGWGLDGVWADDFHHVVRRRLAGDTHGYYQDFEGTADELERTLRQGWLFTGQPTPRTRKPRGTDASSLEMRKFVICLQNHDQIGNRATGERLHHQIDIAAWRAASALLLTAPMTPLLFMGQEWAASTPFLYFTDLEPDLGKLVTEGRRREFADFPEFADPAGRERIPDPQAISTFEASRLDWSERETGVHGATLALYKELLHLRHSRPALRATDDVEGDASAAGNDGVVVRRTDGRSVFWIVVRLAGSGEIARPTGGASGTPSVVLTTEEDRFAPDPAPPDVDITREHLAVNFRRPGAVIIEIS